MLVKSLLLLFAGFILYFAGVHNELVFHNDGHVTDSKFGLFRFNETEFDHIVFLLELFFLFLSFKFFLLVFCQVHRHEDILIFGGIFLTDFLEPNLISELKNVNVVFNF